MNFFMCTHSIFGNGETNYKKVLQPTGRFDIYKNILVKVSFICLNENEYNRKKHKGGISKRQIKEVQ
jgi:hypothetical protein